MNGNDAVVNDNTFEEETVDGVLFCNEYRFDTEYKAFNREVMRRAAFFEPVELISFAVIAVSVAVYSALYALGKVSSLTLYPVAAVLIAIQIFRYFKGVKQSDAYSAELLSGRERFDLRIAFTDDYIENSRVSGGVRRCPYGDVAAVIELKNYIVVAIKNGGMIGLKRGGFTVGDENGLTAFLKEKGIKVK